MNCQFQSRKGEQRSVSMRFNGVHKSVIRKKANPPHWVGLPVQILLRICPYLRRGEDDEPSLIQFEPSLPHYLLSLENPLWYMELTFDNQKRSGDSHFY